MMPARSKIVLVSAAAVLSAAIAVAGVLLVVGDDGPQYEGFDPGDPPITHEAAERELGGALAVGYNRGNSDVALRVNGYPITTAEVLEERARAELGIENLREVVSRIEREGVPHVNTPRGDYFFETDGVSTVPADVGEMYTHLLAVAEKYGPDTMALYYIVTSNMALAHAIEAGHSITDAEVEAHVEEYREHLRKSLEPDDPDDNTTYGRDYRMEEYMKGVGEETFWNDILPERMFRTYTMSPWRLEHLSGIDSSRRDERHQALRSLHEDLLASVTLEFTKHYKLDASLEDARAYQQEREAREQ